MKEKYELHLEGERIENESFSELKKMVEDKPHPYEIYLIKQSKMNSGRYHTRKLDDIDLEKIIRRMERGHSKSEIAKQYHVNYETLSRAIKDYDNQHQSRVIT